jgi:hypothetical protein
MHPWFSMKSYNVHLRLCINEFNLFESFVIPYFCCPVILTVYNLPRGMCIRPKFMFLFTVIPGSNNPSRNIDVYLRLFIDELNQLWLFRNLMYDVSRKHNF